MNNELVFKDGTKITLMEGVDASKFQALYSICPLASSIKNTFQKHNYNLNGVPGSFSKIFTTNEKGMPELENILNEIDALGLKEIFNANLSFIAFTRNFLERVKYCVQNNIEFLNNDNTFKMLVYNKEAFGMETVKQTPVENVAPTEEINANNMDAEDRQVYDSVIEALNYLILSDPTDIKLSETVNNISRNIIGPILRKEYKQVDMGIIISNIMFKGIVIDQNEANRIAEKINKAFPSQEAKVERSA